MIIEQLYDALIDGGTSPDKAREAARAVAEYENRFHKVESTQRLHTWILNFLVALALGNLWLAFSILARLA